jgi:hypothetical protein
MLADPEGGKAGLFRGSRRTPDEVATRRSANSRTANADPHARLPLL